MKVRYLGAKIGQACLITALAMLTGCGKHNTSGKIESPKPGSATGQSPIAYKFHEPKAITSNGEKPIIVTAADFTPPARLRETR